MTTKTEALTPAKIATYTKNFREIADIIANTTYTDSQQRERAHSCAKWLQMIADQYSAPSN